MSAEFRIDILILTNQVGCFLVWSLGVQKFELSLHWSYLACGPTFFFFFFLQLQLTQLSLKKICINEDKSGKLAW